MPLTKREVAKELSQTEKQYRRLNREAKRLGLVPSKEPGDSIITKIFNVLDRPQQAMYQVMEGLNEGQDPNETIKDAWGSLRHTNEKIQFADFLSRAGMQDGKALGFMGFVGDVVADPVNLVPTGWLSKIKYASRAKLLASKSGRRALTWLAESSRDVPLYGSVRNNLWRWFKTRPDTKPSDVKALTESVARRIDELEANEFAVKSQGRMHAIIPGALEDVEDINAKLEILEKFNAAATEGRMPHEVLADLFHASGKSARLAQNLMNLDLNKRIKEWIQEMLKGLSQNDYYRVVKVAEAIGTNDVTLRGERMAKALAGADNPAAIEKAANGLRGLHQNIEDIEKAHGINLGLGGGLRKKLRQYNEATLKFLGSTPEKEIFRIAKAFRENDFLTKGANTEARAMADLLDLYGKGQIKKQDLMGHIEQLNNLRLQFREAKGPLTLLGKAARAEGKGGILSSQDAYRVLTDEILTPNIRAGLGHVRDRRLKGFERLTKFLDQVPGYVLHYMTPEDAERLGLTLTPQRLKSLASATHRSMIHRLWEDKNGVPLPLEDIYKILDKEESELAAFGKSLKKKSMFNLFNKEKDFAWYMGLDPVAEIAIRSQRTAKAIAGQQYVEDVKKLFGNFKGPRAFTTTIPGFGDTKFDLDTAKLIARSKEQYFGDASFKFFREVYDPMQMMWKAYALFPWPAYHARNVIGDMWLMYANNFFTKDVSGKPWWLQPFARAVPDFEAYGDLAKSHRLQTALSTKNIEGAEAVRWDFPNIGQISGNEFFELARREGVIDSGFIADHWSPALEAELKSNGFSVKDAADLKSYFMPGHIAKNPAIKAGRNVAEYISNVHRMAFFAKRLRMGDSVKEAASGARATLLDYQDMTPADVQLFRRVIPFWAWMKHNVPRQLEILFDNPAKVERLKHMLDYAQDENSISMPFLSMLGGDGRPLKDNEKPRPVDIPEWMRGAMPFPLRRRKNGEIEMATLRGYLPLADLESLNPTIESAGKTFMDAMSPLPKSVLETITGRNYFFNQDLVGNSEFMGHSMPARMANALNYIPVLAQLDRMNLAEHAGFSSRRLRPETNETMEQKLLRAFTGFKVYPTDTKLAKLRHLQKEVRQMQFEVKREREARGRERKRK